MARLPKMLEAQETMKRLGAQYDAEIARMKAETLDRIRSGGLEAPTLILWGYNEPSAPLDLGLKLMDVIAAAQPQTFSRARAALHPDRRKLPLAPQETTRYPAVDVKVLCVFCGSSVGKSPRYAEAARALGTTLAERGVRLVYGGANRGLMGEVANAALARGGEVTGVIPGALESKEVAHRGLTELRVVESMHERKAQMAVLSDGFVALPGGLGTLEELFEIMTWGQLGFHRKPFGLLNVDGFFDPLIAFLDHLVAERFLLADHRLMLAVAAAPEPLLEALARYEPPAVEKWIGPRSL